MGWIWITTGAICTTLSIGLVAPPLTQPQPSTYREAVMQVLDKGDIPYRDVVVAEQYRWSYSNVYVSLVGPARSSVSGKISCYYYGADCSLLVQQLGLVNVPLRNLAGVHSRPSRVERIVQYLKALLRVWTQPIQMHMR